MSPGGVEVIMRFSNPGGDVARHRAVCSPVTSRRVRLEDRTITVLATGQRRELPPIVMLPGLGYPGMLGPLLRELSRWTAVELLDLPGWRRGEAVGCPPTVAGVAEATRGILPQLAGSPVLVGHSTGAQAALRAAVEAPDRLTGLVLLGPTVDPSVRSWPRLTTSYLRGLRRERPAELAAVRRSMREGRVAPVVSLIRSALADRPEERIASLRLPTLVLTGEHDRISTPEWCHQLAELSGGRFRLLSGGHNCCYTDAGGADDAVRAFVRAVC
jgi:pimeloyl-ACP methyl ester carboxylesterase